MAAGQADESFPRACRLVSSADFTRVYQQARRGHVGEFTWHARDTKGDCPRLGLAVPKRVVRHATERARLKRLIRESFRHRRNEIPAVDIVVSVRAKPAKLYGKALHKQIAGIWRQVTAAKSGTRRRPPRSKHFDEDLL